MGYTRYWHRIREIPQPTFQAIVGDFMKVLPALQVRLAGGDGTGDPCLTAEEVIFNGVGDDAHETFLFPRVYCLRQGSIWGALEFQYCKTARKPYDLVVAAFLVIAKHHLGDNLHVTSDRGPSGLAEAISHCSAVLGYGDDFRLDG